MEVTVLKSKIDYETREPILPLNIHRHDWLRVLTLIYHSIWPII